MIIVYLLLTSLFITIDKYILEWHLGLWWLLVVAGLVVIVLKMENMSKWMTNKQQ